MPGISDQLTATRKPAKAARLAKSWQSGASFDAVLTTIMDTTIPLAWITVYLVNINAGKFIRQAPESESP